MKLQTAIAETLQNRGTDYNVDSFHRITVLVNDDNMQIKWRQFLRTLHNHDIPFLHVMNGIASFIEPVWDAFIKEDDFQKPWDASTMRWE